MINEVIQGKHGSAYSALRKLGNGPSDHKSSSISVASFVDKSYTDQQSADALAAHFSAISQTFSPLKVDSLPPKVSEAIKAGVMDTSKPVLSDFQVYRKLLKCNKPMSSVEGDIPRKLLIEFLPEFATPVCKIFNKITSSACYPLDWKKEYQIPIYKGKNAQTEDDLRNLTKTKFLSKAYEATLCD